MTSQHTYAILYGASFYLPAREGVLAESDDLRQTLQAAYASFCLLLLFRHAIRCRAHTLDLYIFLVLLGRRVFIEGQVSVYRHLTITKELSGSWRLGRNDFLRPGGRADRGCIIAKFRGCDLN